MLDSSACLPATLLQLMTRVRQLDLLGHSSSYTSAVKFDSDDVVGVLALLVCCTAGVSAGLLRLGSLLMGSIALRDGKRVNGLLIVVGVFGLL